MEAQKTRKYPFDLFPVKALDPSSESYESDRWSRIHEKKRLAAYLKGQTMFAHGRKPAFPVGHQPIMWPVFEKESEE